ncbi:retromer subunit [Martiniozyma asiatica (nom. inval.)]|nr:retromer subunit [Martiniozyma asiatica]
MSKAQVISIEEQQRLLETSTNLIKSEIYQMRKCLETRHKFMDSLKHASNFLNELRTSNLNPKQYYEIYIIVYDGLEYLSSFLSGSQPNNHLIDLYELVQYAGNIIPRLYLIITIGSLYMNVEEAPISEIMKDMLEMCKGVQQPIRGLFLRYYLIQKTKDHLPVNNKENIEKSVNFCISNFIEMNKLWVRWQHQGHSSQRIKRIEERQELKVLVGSNLVRLSQMECVDCQYYKERILPLLLEQIVKCNDAIAQTYLLDVIIQIFPDEFQLVTLNEFLGCLLQLRPDVDISSLIISLVDRLVDFKKRGIDQASITKNGDFFENFINFIGNLNKLRPDLTADTFCLILSKIMKLSAEYFPENFEHLNILYRLALEKASSIPIDATDKYELILLTPVEYFKNITNFFNLDDNYIKLFAMQRAEMKNKIMTLIIESLIKNNVKIENQKEIKFMSEFLSSSILAEVPTESETKQDLFGSSSKTDVVASSSMTREYEFLCRMLHLIYCFDTLENYKLLMQILPLIKSRAKLDLVVPTFVSIILKLIRKLYLENQDTKSIISMFNEASQLISGIKNLTPSRALHYNLLCAEIANECSLVSVCYEFFIEAFIIYEELLIDSKTQYQALLSIMNKLVVMYDLISLSLEDFEKLTTKAAIYGSRLLKKTDQCRAVYNASHLWWIIKEVDDENLSASTATIASNQNPQHISLKKDDKRVLECLQKSLRIADSVMDSNAKLELFVEILNQSIYYFIHGNEMINVRYLNGLIELIGNSFKELGVSKDSNKTTSVEGTWKHFDRTLKYIKEQRSIDPRFLDLVLS